jgi:methylenetetrahydrofolate dehydrogenase (NADP+)/methenyltetrahydrofolate cyclohydrolase
LQILDGKKLSQKIEQSVTDDVKELKDRGITPGLAVILVGSDNASEAYVSMKAKACKRSGIYSIVHDMDEDISQETILETITMMNTNPNIDGILVQLPLPSHIDTTKVLEAIDPSKDVDGFHPFNVGRLVTGLDGFVPATPMGIMSLLNEYNIKLQGKNAVVVGASNIVGKPLSALLLNAGATVEICHIHTDDLKSHVSRADIVLVGVGKINLITKDMIKDGAIVVDIGINRKDDGTLTGDVDYANVASKCSYITPVPGGVGPMTIASLLQNTVKSAQNRGKNR